jgi:hypothetical protein
MQAEASVIPVLEVPQVEITYSQKDSTITVTFGDIELTLQLNVAQELASAILAAADACERKPDKVPAKRRPI